MKREPLFIVSAFPHSLNITSLPSPDFTPSIHAFSVFSAYESLPLCLPPSHSSAWFPRSARSVSETAVNTCMCVCSVQEYYPLMADSVKAITDVSQSGQPTRPQICRKPGRIDTRMKNVMVHKFGVSFSIASVLTSV